MGASTPAQDPVQSQRDPLDRAARLVARRFGTTQGIHSSAGPVLRLTRRQRDLLRKAMDELRASCADDQLWRVAIDEAESAQCDLEIPDLAPGFVMWATNTAAIASGAWWLLMPGCGAPMLQSSMCAYLRVPWLHRRADYVRLADALEQGRFPAMKMVVEWTERVRCAVMINVRDG